MQALGTLQPGDRFHVAALPAVRREVVRIGAGSAVVRKVERVAKSFVAHGADPDRAKPVSFAGSSKVEVMSLGTLVELEAVE